jgi:hypothetical protein
MTASASHKIDSQQEKFYGFLIFIILLLFPCGFTPPPWIHSFPRGFTPMRQEWPMSQGVAEANGLASSEDGDLFMAGPPTTSMMCLYLSIRCVCYFFSTCYSYREKSRVSEVFRKNKKGVCYHLR